MNEGVIHASCSNNASHVLLVSKKDVNLKVIRDNILMTIIDDVLGRLGEANIFTTLHLANVFFHVPMDENSRKYTAFVTPSGQYEFQFVPFGICISTAVFCRYIHAILSNYIRDGLYG